MWSGSVEYGKGQDRGTKEAIKSINAYLGSLEQQLLDAHAILNREADQRLPGYFKKKLHSFPYHLDPLSFESF